MLFMNSHGGEFTNLVYDGDSIKHRHVECDIKHNHNIKNHYG